MAIDPGMALKFRDVLLSTERFAPAEMQEYQRGLLAKLVQHAARKVPYYRTRLQPVLGEGGPAPEAWAQLGTIDRMAVQEGFDTLSAKALPPYAGKVEVGATSGSTGRPLQFRHEELLGIASAAASDRAYGWWGLDGRKTLATFMSTYNAPATVRSRRFGWRIGVREGVREIMELMVDIDRQLDWLAEIRPAYLFVRGGRHAAELAERAVARNLRLRFERMLSTGSPVVATDRQRARQAFKAEIADFYGASETGLAACQCPDCGLYHSCDETMLVEILDTAGQPCAEGETGRVVLTPLYAYAMPLIRYEIGDYAVRGPARAPCGRGLGSLRAIAGRYRNVFVLGDGRIIHPYANAARLGVHLDYRQVQIVQTDYDRIEIRYLPKEGGRTPDEAAIAAFVRETFDPSLSVALVPVASFPPAEGGKFEETLSLVTKEAAPMGPPPVDAPG